MTKIAIIYYSSTGHNYQLAVAAEQGAKSQGAETRLRKVKELASDSTIATNKGWQTHASATKHVEEATNDDLVWADGYVFGTPTRYGAPAAQMKQFLDGTGPVWFEGKLANKPVAVFTGAQNAHGGQESTILAMYNVFMHWGAIVVPPGYTDPAVFAAGGNPYGVSFTDTQGKGLIPETTLAAARYLGARVTRFAIVLSAKAGELWVPKK
jgi:NAD(P)H dehydrogenase (quinone)